MIRYTLLMAVTLFMPMRSQATQAEPVPPSDAEMAIEKALHAIVAQSPQTYPERVTPVPEPGEWEALPDDVLLAMLASWNPALRMRAAIELGGRGDHLIQPLLQALSAESPEGRAGALDAFSRMIGYQLANWPAFRPDETDAQAAQDSIRHDFSALLLDKVLWLANDAEVMVRRAALSVLGALNVQDRQVAKTILTLGVDADAYLADQALSALGRGVGVNDLEPGVLVPLYRQALQNPLPRGKGTVIDLIAAADESLQRELIPDLLAHLDWQPDRDTMFGANGQAAALDLLASLGVQALVQRLPALMDKPMRGAGLFEHCIAAIKVFGADARPILPALKERMNRKEAELKELEGRNDRFAIERTEYLRTRIRAIREAVQHVE